MSEEYDPHAVVDKWLRIWAERRSYEAGGLTADDGDERPRRYVVGMYPYPSGDLHMGHAEVYSVSDAIARYARLRGYRVLNPVGWDSFGLPAENAAFKRHLDPREWTYANIEVQAEGFRRLGVSADWRTRLHTSDPEFYRWNQWLFLRMYERGLAYRAQAPVNWCPVDRTVLANEQVIGGRCERCGAEVVARELTQWFFRITRYAQRLLDDMAQLAGHWPDDVLTMQRNWIRGVSGTPLRDWLVSRQRYWGTPIPVIHCFYCGAVPVPDASLPVRLPESGFELRPGDGRSPLATATDWVAVPCPECGAAAQRDTDTMDTFVDSSWYFLRYPDPWYSDGPFHPGGIARWLPVDEYIGGKEHATSHLLYARFITKVLYDLGLVPFTEPFTRLTNPGQVIMDGRSMSKTLGNVVNLRDQLARYGPDAVRVTMIFAGPPEEDIDWADVSAAGSVKWLARVWRLAGELTPAGSSAGAGDAATGDVEVRRAVHRLIHGTTRLMDRKRFNVAVARLMELTALLRRAVDDGPGPGDPAVREGAEALVRMLSCFAPFTAEEAWERLGHPPSVDDHGWPAVDERLLTERTVVCVVQVAGKVRDRLTVPVDIGEAELTRLALDSPAVRQALDGAPVGRVIVRAPKLVNVLPGR